MARSPSLIGTIDRSGVPLLIARLVAGGVFIFLGYLKLRDPITFLKFVRLYGILPDEPGVFLNTTAIVLPWLEIVCGLALLYGVAIRGASLLLIILLVAFAPALVLRALSEQEEKNIPSFCQVAFDCGCGTGKENICWKLGQNSVLFLLSVLALVSRSRRFCLAGLYSPVGRVAPPPPPPPAHATAIPSDPPRGAGPPPG